MLLASNPFFRERLGVTGLDKVGKSTGLLNTAVHSYLTHYAAAQSTGDWSILQNQPVFHICDLDRQTARYMFSGIYGQLRLLRYRMIPPPTQQEAAFFNSYGNIVLYECYTHEDIEQAVDMIMASARPDDWACVDMVNYCWENVREFYTQQVHKKDLADFELEAQQRAAEVKRLKDQGKKSKSAGAKLDWNDWAAIKSNYNNTVRRLLMKAPCHFYCTFPAESIDIENDSQEVQRHWGATGVKPKGIESNLPFQLRTVLVASKQDYPNHPTQYFLTTQTDTQRPHLKQALVSEDPGQAGFAQIYLQGVAGWQP